MRCVGRSGTEVDSCCSGACAEGRKAAGEASADAELSPPTAPPLLLSGLSVLSSWLVLLLLGVDRSLLLLSLLVVLLDVVAVVLLGLVLLGSGAVC